MTACDFLGLIQGFLCEKAITGHMGYAKHENSLGEKRLMSGQKNFEFNNS